ncbi:hypothetical protein, partial [Klebsiella pneumoniae]|uniref:hypothetical protein n=1 Tax=Klebsiella pneumoniae TaxID=573 RepID=UPI00273220C2
LTRKLPGHVLLKWLSTKPWEREPQRQQLSRLCVLTSIFFSQRPLSAHLFKGTGQFKVYPAEARDDYEYDN